MQSNHVRAIVLSFVMIVGIAACSSTSDTTTLPTTIIIDGTVGGNMMALELDGQPLTVSSQATVRLRGQNALATVVRPGVRLRGTATRDANGRLNLLEGDVSYSRALSGVLQSVSDNSITLQQGERSLTLPLADNLLIHGEVNRADSLPIGRQVTAFGSDDSGGLIIVLELWSAAVTMNTPGVSAPNVSDGDVSDGDASEDVDSGDNGGNNGGNNGGSDGNGEQVFINLPLVRADRNAGVLQLGHPSNALEVRINADTMLDAGSPNPNAFWQAATEGAPVIVEGALAADGVITAWYVAILPSDIEPVPWLALEGRVQQVQPGRGFVLEGLTITSNESTRYAFESDRTNGGDIAAASFWAALAEGDMVFVEGWENANGTLVANFIIRFEPAPVSPQQVLDGRVLSFDAQARWLDLLLDDVVMRIATDNNTTYSEHTDAGIVVPNEPVGSPLTAAVFWNALTEDALITVYGSYDRGDYQNGGWGDFIATHISWRSDETYLSVSGTISDLNEAAQQVRLMGVDVVLQLSERTYFTDPYFFDPMPMLEYPSAVDSDMPMVEGSGVNGSGVEGSGVVSVPEMAEDILPTAPLELFWQEARSGRMVMADGVVRSGVLEVRFLTLLPDPTEPRSTTLEGIVSDLDAASKTFNLLDFPELALDFADTRSYALLREPVTAAAFWAALQEDDGVMLAGILTRDANGYQRLEVDSIDTFSDPVPPPPLFATEGLIQAVNRDSNSVRLFDVPELTIIVPDDALYVSVTAESNGAQFWREVNIGDGVFVEGILEQDRLIVQRIERFDNDRPQVVNAAVRDLDHPARQFALDNAPRWDDAPGWEGTGWLVTVTTETQYSNAIGEMLTAAAFWDTLSEGDSVTVAGTLTVSGTPNAEASLFVADSITLTRRPNLQTIEGTIERVDPSSQQFTLAEVPNITVAFSDETRFAVESAAPPAPKGLIDPRQWLEPGTFVIVTGVLESGVVESGVLRAREVIVFHESYEPIFSEGLANVLGVNVGIDPSDPSGGVTVAIHGELADPCTQLARIDQAFDGNIITLTVITQVNISRGCEAVVVPFSQRVQLEQQLEPGTYTLHVNQQTVTVDIRQTTNPERSAAFVETVTARLLDNERDLQLDITGFLSDPCHIIDGYDVTANSRIDPDGTQEGVIVVQLWQRRVQTFQECAAVLAPFETTLELDALMVPAGEYSVEVNGVQTRINLPDGLVTRSEARVGRVEVLVLESFPLQIQVVAYGVLASSCDSLVGSNVTLAGNRFDITLWQESILAPCLPLTEPFETVIDLDAWGLAAGDYVVDVNGVQSTFNVPVDNIAVDNIPELCGDDCTPATNQP